MDTKFDDDDDDLPENEYRSSVPAVEHSIADLLRPAAQAARSIFEREQRTDVISGLIMTLTNRAFKATARAGKISGYNQKLQEELKRQVEVQSRFATLVAWYEKKTQIVVGGTLSTDRFNEGPHASGIRCLRCNRQVEDHQIEDHLAQHMRENEVAQRAAAIRREEEMRKAHEEATAPVAAPRKRGTGQKKIRETPA